MNDSSQSTERRKREERRGAKNSLPAGLGERRINIERRLFDLGVDVGKAWWQAPARNKAGHGAPSVSDINAARKSTVGQPLALADWILR